ncbi:MAG: phytanoyl-CoA dioxygenase family protein [Actinomycetota bacterium]|nr:phytanoyl-CoA dioxygenase family protein [Actinomycetota bacterium]
MLTPAELEAFVVDGFVAVRHAFSGDVASACVDVVWDRLEEQGVRRDDASTWTRPLVWVPCPEGGPFIDAGTSPTLWEAYDQLIGRGRWPRRRGVGGSVPVRFPSEDDPGYAGWHFDSGIAKGDGRKWSSVHSPTQALLALFLFTDVGEDDAPTLALRGSHLAVAAVLGRAGEDGLEWSSLEPHVPASTFQREVVSVTGDAGDVYLCHPFLVHRASWPHRGQFPRMMAQPSIWLKEPYTLRDERAASAVERAILAGRRPVPGETATSTST